MENKPKTTFKLKKRDFCGAFVSYDAPKIEDMPMPATFGEGITITTRWLTAEDLDLAWDFLESHTKGQHFMLPGRFYGFHTYNKEFLKRKIPHTFASFRQVADDTRIIGLVFRFDDTLVFPNSDRATHIFGCPVLDFSETSVDHLAYLFTQLVSQVDPQIRMCVGPGPEDAEPRMLQVMKVAGYTRPLTTHLRTYLIPRKTTTAD